MNQNWDSSFAWLIASGQLLWQGEGAVSGPVDDAHTGQSKAHSLLTALWFLHHYLQHFPMGYYLTHTIFAYCDNSRAISCITKLLQESPQLTRSTILNDYNVYAKIIQTIANLKPLHIHFQHIKGHQDHKQPIHKLSLAAQYNITCDKCTAATLPELAAHSTWYPIAPMPSSCPHLCINKK